MGEFGLAVFSGVSMALAALVFALAFSILVGRWVTAVENWLSFFVRSVLLVFLIIIVFRQFGSIWYFLMLPLVAVPFIDICLGRDFSKVYRERELAEATAEAAAEPQNATRRIHLARALLASRQVEAGLAALEEAKRLGGESGREVMEQMAAKAKAEFVRYCRVCNAPNPRLARACGGCLSSLDAGAGLRAILWVSRPLLCRVLPKARAAR